MSVAVAAVSGWVAGPERSADPPAADRAAREGAAQFDLSGRTRLVLTGKDRARFLHGFCTNSITTLKPGEGCEAFATSIKGRILEHLFIAVGETSLLIDATAGSEDRLFAHFDRYLITEDVQIERKGSESGEIFVSGPQAAALLRVAGGAGLDGMGLYSHRAFEAASSAIGASMSAADDVRARLSSHGVRGLLSLTDLMVWRVDLLGMPGYRLLMPRDRVAAVSAALSEAGIAVAGRDVFEPLRIEAGLPLYGVDITEDNLAQEAMRTPRAISFRKGCYLGQEPIARIDALGHINRQLAGLRLASGVALTAGALVTGADGKEAGAITSAALAPGASQTVALGLLKSQSAAPGTKVLVASTEGAIEATVFGW